MENLNILITFLLFLSILTSFLVVTSKSPIYSVFFLILVFFISVLILLLLNLSFIGMIFLIIYVGAIAVLFLFVIMLLNLKIFENNNLFFKYIPISGFLSIIFIFEILIITLKSFGLSSNFQFLEKYVNISEFFYSVDDIKALSLILFNYYYILFILSGIILLLSMIGSIVLTFNRYKNNKIQNKFKQLNRDFKKTIKVI